MEPYFVYHRPVLRVEGGLLDGGDVLQEIDTPYRARLIDVLPPGDRVGEEMPAHRVGGEPPNVDLGACPSCGSSMAFFGVLDYDDFNVPLTEDGGRPVALIIGDENCLVISSCDPCAVMRLAWARG